VKVLLLSLGGGGGNILRSLKQLFQRDLLVTEKVDAAYASRLRAAVATRFLDTNAFSLADIPADERVLIGARTTGRLGARHNPEVARAALHESKSEVEALLRAYEVVVLIATGGKGTGAGTIFPIAQIARAQKKLVVPIFVRPSFERHEVDKRRYDHAVSIVEQFDAAHLRLIEILNDRGYTDSTPLPQSVVWERMNLPIARSLRGLLFVLEDLSQVDPSDLAALFAGPGRLRLGFSEIDPSPGEDPSGEQIDAAVRGCWENPYDAFGRAAGTALICIQGHWSNVVDARIKGRLAALVASHAGESTYTPLYARAMHTPRPWGVTALFAEYTGTHPPLEIAWTPETLTPAVRHEVAHVEEAFTPLRVAAAPTIEDLALTPPVSAQAASAVAPHPDQAPTPATFSTLWEFALAVNRSDQAALTVAANGSNGGIQIDGPELRKLLSTVWFRSVFSRLSADWRERLFAALTGSVPISNWTVKAGRQPRLLHDLDYEELTELGLRSDLSDALRSDVQLLLSVGRLWGEDAVHRCQFVDEAPAPRPSRVATLFASLRG